MIEIKNKKAYFDYFIEDTYEAGIVLTGTEIKSVRKGSSNLKDTYARVKNNEIFLINMFIAPYENGNLFNHEERRERKLLLHKKEIYKIRDKVQKEGYSLVPLKLYLKNGKAKILLGVAKGKKTYDKRQALKEKDIKRDLQKTINRY
ncbi:MAG TPA: SsrA-binding protein SmpB [Candidatus Aphodocola excrementigallinarum]|uniref:SsrA-binding protein n=1 Tax=Candidatus Aphodocola excrementigallinarum TaxID=2840670 RepID=A0A9D1IRU4_9FIRM|nr:SsrA-binding protein SmpB [Candidatus Aphodocola excrementigallinarum]